MAGFTTVRDLGSSNFVGVALMRAIDQDFVPGPRVFPAGHAIGITGGHCGNRSDRFVFSRSDQRSPAVYAFGHVADGETSRRNRSAFYFLPDAGGGDRALGLARTA